jgi:hypothetical protein
VNVTYAASDQAPVRPYRQSQTLTASGAAPWDFDLPVATVAAWLAGSYSAYIPADHVLLDDQQTNRRCICIQ